MDNEYCKRDDPSCCNTGQNTLAEVMLATIGAEIAAEITDNLLISIFYGELSSSGDILIKAKFL